MPARAGLADPVIRLLAAWSPGEVRIVAMDAEGVPLDAAIERPGMSHRVGEVWRARITAMVPAMAGAFCDLGGMSGFLPDSAGARGHGVGDVLGVRITRAAQAGKGPRLAAAETPGGAQGKVAAAPHALAQLARQHPGAERLVSTPALLSVVPGARLSPPVTEEVDAAFAALTEPDVPLAAGGRLRIHPTPALTAIDIDSGASSGGREGKAAAQKSFNAALLPELARAIRVRNLSGGIVVDLAGMKARQRAALAEPLAAALAGDPLRPRLLGFTALGFAEISRPRVGPSLAELLSGPHAAGLAALRAAWRAGVSRLRAAPAVVSALAADTAARQDFAREAGGALNMISDPGLGPEGWSIDG